MCTLECHRGKSGLDAGWSFIWFSVLQNIKIIILLYFEFVICNEFWTVRIISLGKWHRRRGNSFLTAIGDLLKFFEIVKAIAGCISGTFRKIPKMYEQLRQFWGITLAKKLIFKVTSDVFDAHCSEHLQPLMIWENCKCFPWTSDSMRWLWQKNWALRSEHANIFTLSLYNEFCQIMDKNTSWLLTSALWVRCSASLLDNSERYLVSVSADFVLLSIWINRGLTEGVFVQEWGR